MIFIKSKKLNEWRGIYCGIGRCNDCTMNVNKEDNVRICVTTVKDGMVINSNLDD